MPLPEDAATSGPPSWRTSGWVSSLGHGRRCPPKAFPPGLPDSGGLESPLDPARTRPTAPICVGASSTLPVAAKPLGSTFCAQVAVPARRILGGRPRTPTRLTGLRSIPSVREPHPTRARGMVLCEASPHSANCVRKTFKFWCRGRTAHNHSSFLARPFVSAPRGPSCGVGHGLHEACGLAFCATREALGPTPELE